MPVVRRGDREHLAGGDGDPGDAADPLERRLTDRRALHRGVGAETLVGYDDDRAVLRPVAKIVENEWSIVSVRM